MNKKEKELASQDSFNSALERISDNFITINKLSKTIYINEKKNNHINLLETLVDKIDEKNKKVFLSSKDNYILIKPDIKDPIRSKEIMCNIDSQHADYSDHYRGIVAIDVSDLQDNYTFIEEQVDELVDGIKKQSEWSSILLLDDCDDQNDIQSFWVKKLGTNIEFITTRKKEVEENAFGKNRQH